MPEPPASLTVHYYIDDDHFETADEIVSECGFHSSEEGGDGIVKMNDYIAYHYQPFEIRDENIESLEECVKKLRQRFPEREVWLDEAYNKDRGRPIDKDYRIYIASTRDEVESDTQGW